MSSLEEATARGYWRSRNQLEDNEVYRKHLENEFAEKLPGDDGSDGVGRRRFMQLMGASMALSGAAACRWKEEKILPLAKRPEDRIPGVARKYASTFELGGVAHPLMVTSNDGRPTKIAGNTRHPQGVAGQSVFAEASVLELYDPDRLAHPIKSEGQQRFTKKLADWKSEARGVLSALSESNGAGLRVLAGARSGPTMAAIKAELATNLPEAKWVEFESVSRDDTREATKLAFGEVLRQHLSLDKARVILCLDDDLFGGHPNAVSYAGDFATYRKPEAEWVSRLYAVESRHTITGGMADHRLPLRSADIRGFVLALEATLKARAQEAERARYGATAAPVVKEQHVSTYLEALVADLLAHPGKTLITVGAHQPADVQAAAMRLNTLLGNNGNTVTYTQELEPERPAHHSALASLVEELNNGAVNTLVVLGGNPVYDAPADVDVASAMAKAKHVWFLSLYDNETAAHAQWTLPAAHYLESFGDARSWDGTISLAQPLIAPLYDGISELELMAQVAGRGEVKAHALVREAWSALTQNTSELAFKKALRDGFVAGTAFAPKKVALADFQVGAFSGPVTTEPTDLEVTFYADSKVYDGRFANSSWLQELPDFMTKLTWDNALLVGFSTAKKSGLTHEGMANVTVSGRSLTVPVYVMAGQAAGSAALALGYGRTRAGHVGGLSEEDITVGFATRELRTSKAPHFGTGAQITKAPGSYVLACTQDHHAIDEVGSVGEGGRDERMGNIIREDDLESYKKHPDFAKHRVHHPPLRSLWTERGYDGQKWGMSIDLSTCIGCNACTVACQAENNIPVVGKDQVRRGREMHWIRIDRYFKGDDDMPQVAHQPVPCMQCEMAPCEQVCPVAATVHSSEGLNDMVYNRCIGTRYCSNNCPFKVRRFNFFHNNLDVKEPRNQVKKMVFNPQVTVRSRGVMEKCTYCVQRINAVKIAAKNEKRPIRDGEIVTACAEACPTNAIVFGDLNDKGSAVAREQGLPRAYGLLPNLNLKTRTQYLAKVRNPNPKLVRA